MLRLLVRAGAVFGTFVVTFVLLMPAGCRTGVETGRRECDNLLGFSTSAPLIGLGIALVTATLLAAVVAYLVHSRG